MPRLGRLAVWLAACVACDAQDAGDDGLLPSEFILDLDGNPRRLGAVDLGAYEVPEPESALAAGAAALALATLARLHRGAPGMAPHPPSNRT